MARSEPRMTFGLPRMHKEPGERRDFLPSLVETLAAIGVEVRVERGIGSGMGFVDRDYASTSPAVRVVDNAEAFAQDVVLTLRSPEGRYELLRPGSTLISMLHFPTRPARVQHLLHLGIQAVSLDSIVDDQGRRLVENCRAVAWNGLETAFGALAETYPEIADPCRDPIRVTIMGAGAIGKHAVEAATKYGNLERGAAYDRMELPGVEVVTIGRNLTGHAGYMLERLAVTDVLVDATQRTAATEPLVPNAWLARLPEHAVICDLVVDPYLLDADPPTVRGIEGIPQGNLDRFVFTPNDPEWDGTVPPEIPSSERRTVVSCYSWPGVHPRECMELYEIQLDPLLRTLVGKGGLASVRPDGDFHERALHRASLGAWVAAQSSRLAANRTQSNSATAPQPTAESAART